MKYYSVVLTLLVAGENMKEREQKTEEVMQKALNVLSVRGTATSTEWIVKRVAMPKICKQVRAYMMKVGCPKCGSRKART